MKWRITAIIIFVVLVGAIIFFANYQMHKPAVAPAANQPNQAQTPAATTNQPATSTQTSSSPLSDPISGGAQRITKKFFGTYVTPKNSPVQPERFTGYHTGVDFETTPAEANIDVSIMAACDGTLVLKKWASGYGGVAVESCTLDGQAVTVIYGHLRLASVSPTVGQKLKAGEAFAVLGTGYSTETDGERKHLHLGIHKGSAINITGYVSRQSDLQNWLDPTKYLPSSV